MPSSSRYVSDVLQHLRNTFGVSSTCPCALELDGAAIPLTEPALILRDNDSVTLRGCSCPLFPLPQKYLSLLFWLRDSPWDCTPSFVAILTGLEIALFPLPVLGPDRMKIRYNNHAAPSASTTMISSQHEGSSADISSGVELQDQHKKMQQQQKKFRKTQHDLQVFIVHHVPFLIHHECRESAL